MKFLYFLLVCTLVICSAQAQQQEHYSRAKIYLDGGNHSLRHLSALGLAVDHGGYKKNTFFTSDFSEREIQLAKDAGFKVDIIIDDVVKYYQEQNKKPAPEKTTSLSCLGGQAIDVPAHFHLGSYDGGYFTYDEMLGILDSMQSLYPGLISVKQAIDTFHSIEGRPIYWVRISNNPTIDQPAKPQMLVSALHHAREPGSLSAIIFYMWYLLEHYNTDSRINTIIDNTELYFVPCVNPDGYLYNMTIQPNGGGLWRKNRRDNGDGTFGVDLNRNYGYQWGYDDIGSSPSTASDSYRGTAGFSEPETQAMKWFAEQHNFRLALNYHTYNNDLIFPWGYGASSETPDSSLFFDDCAFITSASYYRYGICNEMLDYVANGDSDDWLYGDTTKPKTYGITPEVGSIQNGFYPPATDIIPDCENNLISNINAASLLLPFATLAGTDEKILLATTGYLHYNLQRLGLPDTATYAVQVIPLDSWMTVPSTPKVYTGLAMLQQVTDSVSYTLSPAIPNGQLVSYVLQLNNGLYNTTDTISFYYGEYYTIDTPSTKSLADWTNNGWGVCTSTYHTPPACIQSSLDGNSNYQDDETITIATTKAIDLTHSKEAWLQFYSQWALEASCDYVMVQASPTGLNSWQALCGRYTRQGSVGEGNRPSIYDGMHTSNWVQEQMDLSDYLGQKIDIQYILTSDAGVNYKGFYFDDFEVRTVEDSASVSNTGVNNITSASPTLAIYPNPTTDQLTVSVTGHTLTQPLTATLYDYLGREAMTFTIAQPQTTIDVKPLGVGMYYLKVYDNGKILPVQKLDILR